MVTKWTHIAGYQRAYLGYLEKIFALEHFVHRLTGNCSVRFLVTCGYFSFSSLTQKTSPSCFKPGDSRLTHIIYQTLSDTYIITSVVVFLCQKMSDWGHIGLFFPPFLLHICVQLHGAADQTFSHCCFFSGGGLLTPIKFNHSGGCVKTTLFNRM